MHVPEFSLFKSFMTATLATCLTACGGGGSGSSSGYETESKHSNQGSTSGFSTSTNAATNAEAGQALYAAYCATCHGATYGEAKDYASTLSAICYVPI
jgi:cytochrome c5